ncbi:helix-turn-helix transcriptional regulator [Lachnospiraceae bacterium MD1]|uniref:Helix-turn-helix transcriptional regulator n=1 Tax=Variimorphobacter saccharofermentans TaxID=2755051 RepID=A0A839K218_9FIRM|nr:helix-turn-helix transcriptional regulator [Variimorphobacter saccharofermentans]MBB2183955.1 helix-turn-helix transcriptional regulator [Variimorphobacter saccharofermentans]
MDQKRTGRLIAESRNLIGLTQRELAEKIGISDKTISKWECGKSMPDISYLDALCRSLNLSINEIISGERLSETNYSVKAEENIMSLMKENEKAKKKSTLRSIVGILITFLGLFLMLNFTPLGLPNTFLYFIDPVTFLCIALFSVAGVLLSGRKTYSDILEVLQKIAIPNGILITFISIIIILRQLNDMNTLGPNIAVCMITILYSVLEYLIVFFFRQHFLDK